MSSLGLELTNLLLLIRDLLLQLSDLLFSFREEPLQVLCVLFGLTALPTVATFVLEWSGAAPMTSLARAVAALPLGAAIAFLIVSAADRGR